MAQLRHLRALGPPPELLRGPWFLPYFCCRGIWLPEVANLFSLFSFLFLPRFAAAAPPRPRCSARSAPPRPSSPAAPRLRLPLLASSPAAPVVVRAEFGFDPAARCPPPCCSLPPPAASGFVFVFPFPNPPAARSPSAHEQPPGCGGGVVVLTTCRHTRLLGDPHSISAHALPADHGRPARRNSQKHAVANGGR